MSEKKRVLILCTGNSARSQMAEGLLRHEAGDRFAVVSAGVERTYVRPEAVEAMREIGVDISQHRSKFVAAEGDENTKLNIFRRYVTKFATDSGCLLPRLRKP